MSDKTRMAGTALLAALAGCVMQGSELPERIVMQRGPGHDGRGRRR